MSVELLPANELERALVAAQQGKLPVLNFMDTLLTSSVVVLLNKEPGPKGEWDEGVVPMALTNQEGQPVLAVFTAVERSTAWVEREPLFSFGAEVDFAWLLSGIAPGVGIVVNPGFQAGLEMPASGVSELKGRARKH